MNVWPAWSIYFVPGQPGLLSETLSQKTKQRDEIAQHRWPGRKRERHLDLASDNLMKQHEIPKTKGVLEVTSV